MADQKISELTALTGANVADDDAIAIVDTSATETKKIVFSELKNALDTATGFVRITGDTMTGNLNMGDNVKAIFGAGSDLQIYAASGVSYIKESGAGNLNVNAANFILNNADDSQNMFKAKAGAEVELYYNNSQKLETTSTGVDITGTLTSDGITTSGVIKAPDGSAAAPAYTNSGDTDGGMYFPAANQVAFATGGAEAMRIDSSGNVGIGTSSVTPYQAGNTTLEIDGGANKAELRLTNDTTGASANNANGAMFHQNGNATYLWNLENDILSFGTNNNERMRIKSDGNVSINSDGSITALDGVSGAQIGNSSAASAGLALETSNRGYLWYIGSGSSSLNLWDSTANSDRLVIDSSGNLLVGTTNLNPQSSSSDSGMRIGDGFMFAGRSGEVAILNRQGSDGDIAVFRKDGSTVGSIASALNGSDRNLDIGSGDTRLLFYGPTSPAYVPRKANNSASDGYADLGLSSNRFKDLYLSGGVYLGGTGSGNPTNKLDDYEAGDFNAALTPASGSITVDASYNKLLYTKVGRLVTITGRIRIGSVSSASGAFYLTLPFTSINFAEEADFAALNLITYNVDLDANVVSTFGEVNPNSTDCYAYQQRDNNTWITIDASGVSAGDILYFSGTYVAA